MNNKKEKINDLKKLLLNKEQINPELKQIKKLEKITQKTFKEENNWINDEPNLLLRDCFLYHAIRHYNQLERLENIFKDGKILAGKYLTPEFKYNYSDNCNDDEYVSLLEFDYDYTMNYDIFIRNNITFVINHDCNAIKTTYISYDLWKYIKDNNIPVKNRYSYAIGEYQVKDYIPLELVCAIGIPYHNLQNNKGTIYAEEYKETIINLMKQYNIKLPIVDTSSYHNDIIYTPIKEKKRTLVP